MKKNLLLILAVSLSSFVYSQGIQFENLTDWSSLVAKAKKENKGIFIDCFATWCVPCKQMDKEVYTDSALGSFINQHFISVKVQMDSTKNDNDVVKNWRNQVVQLVGKNKVLAFPSFLFFSPSGKILHRDIGFKSVDDFLALSKDAQNPDRQYYTLLEKYRNGNKEYKSLGYLSAITGLLEDRSLADTMARDYIDNYLVKASEKDLYTAENIYVLSQYLLDKKYREISSGSPVFAVFNDHPDRVNAVTSPGYANGIVDQVINNEIITSALGKCTKDSVPDPDWKGMHQTITKKFGSKNADRTIAYAKPRWYFFKKEWNKTVLYAVKRIEKFDKYAPITDTLKFNNIMYFLFLRSDNKEVLNKAAGWETRVIDTVDHKGWGYVDTYACLLYRAGNVSEAIRWEKWCVEGEKLYPTGYPIAKYEGICEKVVAMMEKGEDLRLLTGYSIWPYLFQ